MNSSVLPVGGALLSAMLLLGCGDTTPPSNESASSPMASPSSTTTPMNGGLMPAVNGTVAPATGAPPPEAVGPDGAEPTTLQPSAASTAAIPRPVTALAAGCPGQMLREGIPQDLSEPGPWSVGALTTTIDGLQVEVWYPAEQGSSAGATPVVYDTLLNMPLEERARIPDANNPVQPCDCFRGLPLDTEAGPYPMLLFIHGTASFRTSNLENMVHWASRGFVVMAADHPGIQLCDMFAMFTQGTACGSGDRDQAGQGRAILEAAATPSGDLAFLDGFLDHERIGVMGHSAGAGAVGSLGDLAEVVVIYAAPGSSVTGERVVSVLYAGGDQDGVVPASRSGYDNATQPTKRLASIARGGHLVGGSLCGLRDPTDGGSDIVDLASEFQLGGPSFASILPIAFGTLFDGCNELTTDDQPFINGARGISIVNGLTAGVFEEVLHCASDAADRLLALRTRYEQDISDYQEAQVP